MRAMMLTAYGPEGRFELRNCDQPQPRADEVLVRIAASSVNPVDLKIRAAGPDSPLAPKVPAILGMDFAGTVAAVGAEVTGFNPGDEVYGCAGGLANLPGTLAEYIAADAKLIAHKPRNLSMREAAAVPLVGITAVEGLQRAGVAAGQRVLVHGGTGGVGHVAVQIARHMGAEVFATGSTPAALQAIASMGATPINYRTAEPVEYVAQYTGGAGFDVVYDTVGGANMLASFEAAALNGQVITTVSRLELDLSMAHFKGLSIHVVFMLIPMIHNHQRQAHHEILQQIARACESGDYTPLVDPAEYSVTQVEQAHAHLASGNATGKVVMTGF